MADWSDLQFNTGDIDYVAKLNQFLLRCSALVDEIDLKAPLASPVFTGTPSGPTPPSGNNSTRFATTEFTQGELAGYLKRDGSAALTGDMDFGGYKAKNLQLSRYTETIGVSGTDWSLTSGVLTLDLAGASFFPVLLNQNVTSIVLNNVPATGVLFRISLEFKQDGTGGRTVAGWPATSVWSPGGTVPTLSSAPNATDLIEGWGRTASTAIRWARSMVDIK